MKGLNNLLPDTKKVLQKLATLPLLQSFTFVGGSALAVYLGHRLSEYLDLLSWHADLQALPIQNTLQNSGFESVRIVNLSPQQADFVVDGTKVTFFANGWDELKNRIHLFDYLYIAQLPTLAVMKVNTLFLRAKYRDYYDLYVLNQEHFSLEELFEMTSVKMKNLSKTLFQRALIFTDDIADENIAHLNPSQHISLSQISKHFQKQIKHWNKLKL
ncbi:MAG: nucleotidyl transferase AbiEii/AbiGii toxin family protein [Thermaurantimonas sp.]|uniref:nucleotidyl transferase AbiEii/AbiGii toxin family protein n=1 Tax=Thermaurantimonas sp. TaxID=2681568 RepID=UPI00391BA603